MKVAKTIMGSAIVHCLAMAFILTFQPIENIEQTVTGENAVENEPVELEKVSLAGLHGDEGEEGASGDSKDSENSQKTSGENDKKVDREEENSTEAKAKKPKENPSPQEPEKQKKQVDESPKSVVKGDDEIAETNDEESDKDTSSTSEKDETSADSKGLTSASGDSSKNSGNGQGNGKGSKGDGAGAGLEGSGGGGGGISDIKKQELLRGYSQSIYKILSRKMEYPPMAKRTEMEGVVTVKVEIDRDGRILGVAVTGSSGHKILDEAAVKLFKRLKELPAPPKQLAWTKKKLEIPVEYSLS